MLEFEKLLLREPDTARSPAEGNITIDDDNLRDLADFVWEAQGSNLGWYFCLIDAFC